MPFLPVTLNFVPFGVCPIHGVNPIFLTHLAEHQVLAPPCLAEFFKDLGALLGAVVKVDALPVLIPKPTPFPTHSGVENVIVAEMHIRVIPTMPVVPTGKVLRFPVLVDERLQGLVLLAGSIRQGDFRRIGDFHTIPRVTKGCLFTHHFEGSPSLDLCLLIE